MRLIDAEALIKYMCDHCGASCNLEDECCSHIDTVGNQSTVDAVPVIRCKDCKWRLNDGYCLIPKGCRQIVADEHYCSRGERWDDNAE